MITKKEIAEKLGVSRTTVSLVLNRKPGTRISEETAQRVLEMARKMGYKEQNDMEIQDLICYILCNRRLDQLSYFESLRAFEAVAFEANMRTVFTTVDHTMDDYNKVMNLLKSPGVKGAVVAGDFDRSIIEYIKSLNVPFVANGVVDIEGINLVFPDHRLAGFEATEYLLEQGHKRIAFFTGELHKLTHSKLLDGYRKALEKHNIPYDTSLVQISGLERGDELVRRIEGLGIDYTAIFAANEQMGIDALTELKSKGIDIPEGKSIIAVGGSSFGIQCRPKLSVMGIDDKVMAKAILELLGKNISDLSFEPRKTLIRNNIVERESTAPCINRPS